MGLHQLVLRYLTARVARQEIATSSAKTMRWVLMNFAASCPREVARVKRQDVERWLGDQRVAAGTLRSRLSIVRTFCNWLVVEGHVRKDPTAGIIGPRKLRHQPRALVASQVAATLSACPDARAELIVTLMVSEGLRRAEVASLQCGDVDLRNRLMLVRGKGDAERYLPITDLSFAALARYLHEWPTSAGPLVRSYLDPVRAISPDHVGRIVADWMRAAGIKHRAWDGVSAHALRHTAASDVLDNGAHIRQVQVMLGHASLATTERYLRRVDAADLLPVMNGRNYTNGNGHGHPHPDAHRPPDAQQPPTEEAGGEEGCSRKAEESNPYA